MADDDDKPPALAPQTQRTCGWFAAGFLLAGLAGLALAFIAFQNNAPMWVGPVAFFIPPVLYFFAFSSIFFSRLIRQFREAARNSPSPESVAAAAGGEGVEIGAKPEPDEPAEADDTPTVAVVETTPGKVLAHRLARSGMPAGCEFGCAVGIAVFWNLIVGFFVYRQAAAWNQAGGGFGGGFRWLPAAFLVPFVLVGVVMIAYTVYAGLRWVIAGLVGTVEVELSVHPLVPGSTARVRVSQGGPFPLARVFVRLVCTEAASFVVDTSKSTAKYEAAAHTVSDPEQSLDGGGLPRDATFIVPADAMHSFDAPNNEINWTLRVSGHVLGLPFTDDYSVTVAPA